MEEVDKPRLKCCEILSDLLEVARRNSYHRQVPLGEHGTGPHASFGAPVRAPTERSY